MGSLSRRLPACTALMLSGCGDVLHSTNWSSLCDAEPGAPECGGDSTGGAGGAGGGPSGGAGGEVVGGTGSGGDGGSGGAAAGCGNGVLEEGEECDAGDTTLVGCTGDCQVDCSGMDEHERPTDHTCYLFVPTQVSWLDARAACNAWSGELSAINGSAEQTFVEPFLATGVWIGGTDARMEHTFTWVTGEAFDYDNWDVANGQPVNLTGAEDCIRVRGSAGAFTWQALDCATVHEYLCERPAPVARQ